MTGTEGRGARRLEGRNGAIWADYCAGYTQDALADMYGISQQRVSQIIAQVRATIPPTDLDEARQRVLGVLDELQALAVQTARAEPAPAYSNGRMMTDEDGRPILDHAARLQAIRVATSVTERAAKLLGLDAPAKVEHGMTDQAKDEAAKAAADALSRLHGE